MHIATGRLRHVLTLNPFWAASTFIFWELHSIVCNRFCSILESTEFVIKRT